MPRTSNKKDKNIYQNIRESLDLTRDEASALLEFVSPERIERIESGRYIPKADEILQMAEKYKAPELCNYYCTHHCDVGNKYVPEIEMKDLGEIVIELLASVNHIKKSQSTLIDISADGEIDTEELQDFISIQAELDNISLSVRTLKLWTEKMIADGKIDVEKYNELKA